MEFEDIYRLLLKCNYTIKKRKGFDQRYGYCMYDGNRPVYQITSKQFNKIYFLMKEKKEVFTLNLNKVRQQSGHTTVKKVYKQNLKNKQLSLGVKFQAAVHP